MRKILLAAGYEVKRCTKRLKPCFTGGCRYFVRHDMEFDRLLYGRDQTAQKHFNAAVFNARDHVKYAHAHTSPLKLLVLLYRVSARKSRCRRKKSTHAAAWVLFCLNRLVISGAYVKIRLLIRLGHNRLKGHDGALDHIVIGLAHGNVLQPHTGGGNDTRKEVIVLAGKL